MIHLTSDYYLDKRSFDEWTQSGFTNDAEMKFIKEALKICIKDYLSEKQKLYLLEYYVNSKTTEEIAQTYDVNKSTVSRTIKRAMYVIMDHLKFCSPRLLYYNGNPKLTRHEHKKETWKNHQYNDGLFNLLTRGLNND